MNKSTLRKLFLQKRQTLTPQEHNVRSHNVCQRVIRWIEETQVEYCHVFLPIEKFSEIDTTPIFDFLVQSPSHKAVTSICDFQTKTLRHALCDANTQFGINKYGIREPIEKVTVEEGKLDVVFTPLISFDRKGNRIGYGGGFYDKFLPLCKPDCLKIGLAITPPLDLIDYCDPHDYRLDLCLTHQGLYNFKN